MSSDSYSLPDRLRALVAITRPTNVFITAVTIIVAGLIAGITRDKFWILAIAAVSAAFLAAFGNVVNDIFDISIDKINKPRRVLASGRLSIRSARFLAVALAALGVVLAGLVSMPVLGIAVISVAILYAYSSVLKHIPLVGNITVGLMTGLAFIYGGFAAGHPESGVIPAVFAFFYNIGREILKDIEDIEGDKAGKIRTFPIWVGAEYAMTVATVVFAVTVALTFVPYVTGWYGWAYLAVVVIGVDAVLAALMLSLWKTPTRGNIGRICLWLKYDMIVGIAAIYTGTHFS
ncbi:MAG: UbiA family prenyltransferase [Chlorobi bacterium]|nr:UbiA family prenyltransferase [Chlorobiota bacterium]